MTSSHDNDFLTLPCCFLGSVEITHYTSNHGNSWFLTEVWLLKKRLRTEDVTLSLCHQHGGQIYSLQINSICCFMVDTKPPKSYSQPAPVFWRNTQGTRLFHVLIFKAKKCKSGYIYLRNCCYNVQIVFGKTVVHQFQHMSGILFRG